MSAPQAAAADAAQDPAPGRVPGAASNVREGLWRLCDPKITLASAASMLVGACAAAAHGPTAWGWLALTVVGIFLLEAAKNASGEVFDFDSGVDALVEEDDRSPFSGGKRVIMDGLLTRRQTAIVAAALYALGVGVGAVIAAAREPAVLAIGIPGVLLAYFYHAPPLKLSYHGLGELAVGIVYGPLIACGTYLVQRGEITLLPLAASLPLGLLIASFLWIAQFPDFHADRAAGKRTLVVRLGRPAAARVLAALIAVAFLAMALLPLLGSPAAIGGLAGLPHGAAAARRVLAAPATTAHIVPAQRWMLLSFVLAAAGIGLGVVVG